MSDNVKMNNNMRKVTKESVIKDKFKNKQYYELIGDVFGDKNYVIAISTDRYKLEKLSGILYDAVHKVSTTCNVNLSDVNINYIKIIQEMISQNNFFNKVKQTMFFSRMLMDGFDQCVESNKKGIKEIAGFATLSTSVKPLEIIEIYGNISDKYDKEGNGIKEK